MATEKKMRWILVMINILGGFFVNVDWPLMGEIISDLKRFFSNICFAGKSYFFPARQMLLKNLFQLLIISPINGQSTFAIKFD